MPRTSRIQAPASALSGPRPPPGPPTAPSPPPPATRDDSGGGGSGAGSNRLCGRSCAASSSTAPALRAPRSGDSRIARGGRDDGTGRGGGTQRKQSGEKRKSETGGRSTRSSSRSRTASGGGGGGGSQSPSSSATTNPPSASTAKVTLDAHALHATCFDDCLLHSVSFHPFVCCLSLCVGTLHARTPIHVRVLTKAPRARMASAQALPPPSTLPPTACQRA